MDGWRSRHLPDSGGQVRCFTLNSPCFTGATRAPASTGRHGRPSGERTLGFVNQWSRALWCETRDPECCSDRRLLNELGDRRHRVRSFSSSNEHAHRGYRWALVAPGVRGLGLRSSRVNFPRWRRDGSSRPPTVRSGRPPRSDPQFPFDAPRWCEGIQMPLELDHP